MIDKRWVAIQSDLQSHYIDHLGVLCAILKVPYLFTDEQQLQIAQKYYPNLNARYVEPWEISPAAIYNKYDVLLTSHCWNRELFEQAFEMFDESHKIISIFCPHGNSDKGDAPGGLDQFLNHDGVLVYGQHMIDFLKEVDVWDKIGTHAITGNYRYSYYREHQAFYEKIIQEEVLTKFTEKKKILLFSPTWNEDFFFTLPHVLDNIPSEYNVIVKVHPRLMLDHLGLMIRAMGHYENRENVIFLTDFPLIFPLLQHADIYVGDVSSIGYDFLAFNRPMFFLNSYPEYPNPARAFFLYQCGVEILPQDHNRLYSIIEDHLSQPQEEIKAIRDKLYSYAFGKNLPLQKVYETISFCLKL